MQRDGALARPERLYGLAPHILPESGIRRMYTLAATMTDVRNLSVGQPDAPTPPHVIDAYVEALRGGQTRYTADQGHPLLLNALARHYSLPYALDLAPTNFLVTCGGCEAVYIALRTVVNPGDEVILFEPAFVLFKPVIELCGATPVIIPTTAAEGYLPDPERVAAAITPRTSAIIVNSPGNPSGACFPPALMCDLIELARRHGLWMIADEVYERITYDVDFQHVARLAGGLEGLLVIGSFSKTYSMAGMRIGYLVSTAETISMARKVHMYTSNVENTAGQIAAVAALEGDQGCVDDMVAEYRRRRRRLVELVDLSPGLVGYEPQGAFYLTPALPPGVDSMDFCLRLLEETGVCTVPGATFGETARNSFRIAYSADLLTIEEAFERIIPWLEKQSY